MNLKTMLLASAAALFATQANAADITNPFYLPTEGHFLSTTTLQAARAHYEKNHISLGYEKENTMSETLAYGLTDDWSVYGTIENTFMHHQEVLNNDHNFAYALGTAYNYTADKWLVQVHGQYNTLDPRSWVGKRNVVNNRWLKELNAGVKVGYEAGCGFTPYATFDVTGNIDAADRYLAYSAFLGAHKQVDKVAVDAGVRYDFTTDHGYYEDANDAWKLEADVDYYVRDNVTVGAYGTYYLGGEDHNYVDYDYTLGLALKVAF